MASGNITNKGSNMAIDRLFNSSPTYSEVSKAQFGACKYANSVTDTKVYFPVPIDVSSVAIIDDCETADWSAENDGDSPTLNTEAGYHLEDASSLNLLTTHSAGSAGYYKTFSNFDVTDKYFCLPIRINDLTDITAGASALTIDLGTGGFTNYNRYTFNKTLLQAGWNYIVCNGNTADTTGGTGATLTTINRVKLTITNATSWVASDMVMDWVQTYDMADTFMSFTSGYPIQTEADKEVTYRFSINSVQANNYAIRELGVFDDTGTYLYARDVFTTINKDEYITLTTELSDIIENE